MMDLSLQRALGIEGATVVVLVAGWLWAAWTAALTLVALISLILTCVGLYFSIRAVLTRPDTAGRIALVASAFLLVATLAIGFIGYASGV
jgi:hypothetical protein